MKMPLAIDFGLISQLEASTHRSVASGLKVHGPDQCFADFAIEGRHNAACRGGRIATAIARATLCSYARCSF
jgi:hypothetical protein